MFCKQFSYVIVKAKNGEQEFVLFSYLHKSVKLAYKLQVCIYTIYLMYTETY